jgi:dinuclear metal center YbgI/SA1388 family protein
MKVNELITRLNKKFPEYIQEPYDNTGSQILFHEDDIKKIYICLDADFNTVNDARQKGCNLIISHHPLIFRPIKKIISTESKSGIIIDVISSRMSLYSMHTNFDKIMYKKLSDFLGYPGSVPLIKTHEIENADTGFGSFIMLGKEKKFNEILYETRSKLGLDFILYSGEEEQVIRSIAFINGSGGGSIEKVISTHNPDCIITGDVSYHHSKYAIDCGTAIIDAGHFGTEFIFKKLLAESVDEVLYDEKIGIIISVVEKNPFKVYYKNEK